MSEQSPTVETAAAPTAKRTLALAIVTPFAVIALMAAPLLVDVLRQSAGF